MHPNRIHIVAPANPLGPEVAKFGLRDIAGYLAFARQHLPRPWRLTFSRRVLDATEREFHGGRDDDDARVHDLQAALDDPRTAAIIATNGGAYLSRILPHVDFSPLARRTSPLVATGFSEISSLVNLVASYRGGRGVYWLGPNYLGSKIHPVETAREALAEFWRRTPELVVAFAAGEMPGGGAASSAPPPPDVNETHAASRMPRDATPRNAATRNAAESRGPGEAVPRNAAGLRGPAPSASSATTPRVARRVASAPRGRRGIRDASHESHLPLGPIVGKLVSGRIATPRVRLVGGCLSVLAAVSGGRIGARIRPKRGHWLMIEDIKESPYRLDRLLATLKIAGWFDALGGVLVGDFVSGHTDTQPALLELLRYHLPRGRTLPIVTTRSFGHTWPIVPVLLNTPLEVHTDRRKVVRIG